MTEQDFNVVEIQPIRPVTEDDLLDSGDMVAFVTWQIAEAYDLLLAAPVSEGDKP